VPSLMNVNCCCRRGYLVEYGVLGTGLWLVVHLQFEFTGQSESTADLSPFSFFSVYLTLMAKKILHVIYNDKFIKPFIDLILDNNFHNKHIFLYFGGASLEKFPAPKGGDVLVINEKDSKYFKMRMLLKHFFLADRIILHSLFNIHLVKFLFIFPWFLKKCYWFMWGGDLYRFNLRRNKWRDYRNEYLRSAVIKRIGYLVTYIPGDVDLARKWYSAKGRFVECIMYQSNVFTVPLGKLQISGLKTLLVGNSADPFNNHEFIFKKLAKLRLDGWRIIVPLSYGDNSYAGEIIKLGNELFGDKFEPLTDFLSYNNYLRILSNVNIAVFAHDRQQGMGNIITLLGMGKTVYMKQDVSSAYFLRNLGVTLFDVDMVTLFPLADTERKKNISCIVNYFNSENLIKQLDIIFR